MSSSPVLLDSTGRRRSPAAMPGHNAGRPPRNKGMRYPADPPTVEEIVAVMRKIPLDRHGLRLRAMIVVLWRGGLRIQEALDLTESDLDARRGSILVRAGKGNKRREVGMDPWAWSDHLAPWVACRTQLPLGPLFCVLDGATRGRPWSAPRSARNCAATRLRPGSGAALRHISSAMLTLSSSPAKACRYP
jgi:integrase